jgi:hypothetical protein
VIIYSSQGNGIRVEIDAQGPALKLFKTRERNALVRDAMAAAGGRWIHEPVQGQSFLDKRFTPYVTRRPFGYPKEPVGLASRKLRLAEEGPLVGMWQRICARNFHGWDPWSAKPPPERLQEEWMRRNPGEYTKRKGIIARTLRMIGRERKRLRADVRRWAKQRVRKEIIPNLIKDELILPLVHEDKLRKGFSRGARARATSTTNRSRLIITIPRGNRQAATVNRVLTKLPYWEFNFIRKQFTIALIKGINGRPTSSGVAAIPMISPSLGAL